MLECIALELQLSEVNRKQPVHLLKLTTLLKIAMAKAAQKSVWLEKQTLQNN